MSTKVKTTLYFDGYKLGRSQKFFMVIAALTYGFDLMDMSMFQIVSPILQENYGITNEKLATLNFLFFFGSFFGSIAGGVMADWWGRKKAMLINICIFSLASLANALWEPHHLILLEASRFMTGFGTMAACTVAIAYISEMLPSEKRGKYQSLILGIGTFSIPFISILASTVATRTHDSWRIVLVIGALMLLLVPFCIFLLQESPRWLISKGKVKEAEQVMEKCLGFECDMSGAYKNYQDSVREYKKISTKAQFKIMFAKEQMQQTLVCFVFAYCLGIGNNMMSSYNNAFLVQIGFPMQLVLLIGAAAAFGQPFGELISSIFSDKGGRTKPICIYCSIAAIMFVAIGLSNNVYMYGVTQFTKTLFTAGAMALLMTYIPESFPTSVRGAATGYIYGTQKLLIAIVSSLLPVWAFTNFGWFGVNFSNAIFWALAAIVIGLFGRKTALKNIDAMNCYTCDTDDDDDLVVAAETATENKA